MSVVSATYLALVHIQFAGGTRVSSAGAVTVVEAAGWVLLTGAIMKTWLIVACDEYRLGTVGSSPRPQTQTEVGPGNVHTLSYTTNTTTVFRVTSRTQGTAKLSRRCRIVSTFTLLLSSKSLRSEMSDNLLYSSRHYSPLINWRQSPSSRGSRCRRQRVWWGMGRVSPPQLRGFGERRELPSGVLGKALAANAFSAYSGPYSDAESIGSVLFR